MSHDLDNKQRAFMAMMVDIFNLGSPTVPPLLTPFSFLPTLPVGCSIDHNSPNIWEMRSQVLLRLLPGHCQNP